LVNMGLATLDNGNLSLDISKLFGDNTIKKQLKSAKSISK